jgi:hypothetical protein
MPLCDADLVRAVYGGAHSGSCQAGYIDTGLYGPHKRARSVVRGLGLLGRRQSVRRHRWPRHARRRNDPRQRRRRRQLPRWSAGTRSRSRSALLRRPARQRRSALRPGSR